MMPRHSTYRQLFWVASHQQESIAVATMPASTRLASKIASAIQVATIN
jgi:hypothetical protein